MLGFTDPHFSLKPAEYHQSDLGRHNSSQGIAKISLKLTAYAKQVANDGLTEHTNE